MFLREPWPAFLLSPGDGSGGAGGGDGNADGAGGAGGSGDPAGGGAAADAGGKPAGDAGKDGAGKGGPGDAGKSKAGEQKAIAPGAVLGDDDAKIAADAKAAAAKKAADEAADPAAKAAADKKAADEKAAADKKAKDAAKKAPKDGYKVDAKAIELPAGMEIDEAVTKEFAPIATELDLSQDDFNKVAKVYAKIKARDLQQFADTVKGWEEEGKKDEEIGGAKYDESVSNARAALAEYGTPELRHFLFYSGNGNHKELLRFCSRIGAALKQGQGITPRRGGGNKPLAERIYGADGQGSGAAN